MSAALVIVSLLVSGPPPAEPPPWPRGRIERKVRFPRSVQVGQPAGPQPVGRASVYLPAAYDRPGKRTFPVLVLLHGLGGEDVDWMRHGHIGELLDEAIGTGKLRPVIAVMPDGGSGYWTDWMNGAAKRRYGTLVEPDLTSWVDRTYRTNGRRAIAGVSMGGFGAMSIALRHRGRYAAAVSLSGALFLTLPTGRRVYMAAFGFPGPMQWRFATINPYDLVRLGYADGLPIWLDCGADDLSKFTRGLRGTSAALTAAGVPHVARFREGGHRWSVWRAALADILPWVGRQLTVRSGSPKASDEPLPRP